MDMIHLKLFDNNYGRLPSATHQSVQRSSNTSAASKSALLGIQDRPAPRDWLVLEASVMLYCFVYSAVPACCNLFKHEFSRARVNMHTWHVKFCF